MVGIATDTHIHAHDHRAQTISDGSILAHPSLFIADAVGLQKILGGLEVKET
jgi:hypothetical protein